MTGDLFGAADREEVIAELRAEVANGQPCAVCSSVGALDADSPRSRVRASDPSTSRKGASDVAGRVGSQRRKLLEAFSIWTSETQDLTPDEAMRHAGISPRSCYWHRVSDLAQAGLIELTGNERPGESGSDQRCYRITTLGRNALARAYGAEPGEAVA